MSPAVTVLSFSPPLNLIGHSGVTCPFLAAKEVEDLNYFPFQLLRWRQARNKGLGMGIVLASQPPESPAHD